MKTENVRITALAYGGDGIGRLSDNRVCFVPGTIPGETVCCQVTEDKKRFVRAVALEIIEVSDSRIEPMCPYYRQCPGCVYMHCDYNMEVQWKNQQFRDFLLRNSLAAETVIQQPFFAEKELFYRNKLTLHRIAPGTYGYYAYDNTTLFPVSRCLLADEQMNIPDCDIPADKLLLRFTRIDGSKVIDHKNPSELIEHIDGAGDFAVAGNGFFQTNSVVAAKLVEEVKRAFASSEGKELLELYCGVGVFSIAIADSNPDVRCTGIELNKEAIGFARRNASAHHVDRQCRFFAADAAKSLKKWRNRNDLTVLTDPPRSGISREALQGIVNINAGTLIYISCAADTLVRDLKILVNAGYSIVYARMLDMFPRTGHFESLVVLKKD